MKPYGKFDDDLLGLLGNQFNRFRKTTDIILPTVLDELDAGGCNIDRLFDPIDQRMSARFAETICHGADRKSAIRNAGALYSWHILDFNLRTLGKIRDELPPEGERTVFFEQLLAGLAVNFFNLNRGIISAIIDYYLETTERETGRPVSRFAIFNVGAVHDQDDIDVAIVMDRPDPRIDSIISRLGVDMLKSATHLHFYLADQMTDEQYGGPIDRYIVLLNREIRNFVIISQVIGASFIAGEKGLYDLFDAEVIGRYYPPEGMTFYQEGYIRGVIEEIQQVRQIVSDEKAVNPKTDGYRLIKNAISAVSVRYGLRGHSAINAMRILGELNSENSENYLAMREGFAFIETMRSLFNIIAAGGHTILVHEQGFADALDQIAELLGFGGRGSAPRRKMIARYHEHLAQVRSAVEPLADLLLDYLRDNSHFRKSMLSAADTGMQSAAALEFMRLIRQHRGRIFFEDAIDIFRSNPTVTKHFLTALAALPNHAADRAIESMIDFFSSKLNFLFDFVVVLHETGGADHPITRHFLQAAIDLFGASAGKAEALAATLAAAPLSVSNFLGLLSSDESDQLLQKVREAEPDSEDSLHSRSFEALIKLHNNSSRYFRRFFQRVFDRYPKMIFHISDDQELSALSTLLRESVVSNYQEKVARLEDYFDVELVRLAVAVLSGNNTDPSHVYRVFSDRFITGLVAAVTGEAARKLHRKNAGRLPKNLGIFATGGSAREEAFDNDYDFLIFSSSNEPNDLKYYNKVIAMITPPISRRAISPQFRSIEKFGSYVVTIDQFADYLAENNDTVFIDQSELLGARLVVGSGRLEKIIEERLVIPYVFERRGEYLERMAAEVRDRRGPQNIDYLDLKEDAGGIRDIQMALLMIRAHYQVRLPITARLMEFLNEKVDQRLVAQVFSALNFMLWVRNTYHLAVAYDDLLHHEGLEQLGQSLVKAGFTSSSDHISDRIGRTFSRSEQALAELMKAIGLPWI